MRLIAPLVALAFVACATGSTFRSGVADRLLQHPPFYAGTRSAQDTGVVGHLPIAYQRGAAEHPMFDPASGPNTPLATLQNEMNRYLDSLGASAPLISGAASSTGIPPDVRFSCESDLAGDCVVDTTRALGRGDSRMLLAVGRPSNDWVASTSGLLDRQGAVAALVITLEIGQYRIRESTLLGKKEVELGTGYVVRLPWFTSLETPVRVLQLTGALVGRDGRALRIGAEGLLASRTGLVASALGFRGLITDREVEELRVARRDDLPDRPLVWQVALRNLVTGLTARPANPAR